MKTENLYYYGNYVILYCESEREEAKRYLESWMKYFVRELPKGSEIPEPKEFCCQYISRKKMTGHFSLSETEISESPAVESIKIAIHYSGKEKMPERFRIDSTGIQS